MASGCDQCVWAVYRCGIEWCDQWPHHDQSSTLHHTSFYSKMFLFVIFKIIIANIYYRPVAHNELFVLLSFSIYSILAYVEVL